MQAIMMTAASDDVAPSLDTQTPPASARSDVSADNAFFTEGCAMSLREMPRAHENSGLRNLVSFDDLDNDQILNYSDLERLDELRDKIRHRGVERKNRFWWCMLRGTAIFDVTRHPVFVLCYAVYGIMLWWYKRPDDSDAKVYGLVLTVLGGSLSFATIFLNSETYQRFRISYLASCKCQGCIFNTATLARASLRDVVARTIVRYICAAYMVAFAGLRDSHYDTEEVVRPFVRKYGLLTEAEWKALEKRGNFTGTGDRYREIIAWTQKLVNEERDAGRCHADDAWRLSSDILTLRGKLAVAYDILGQPVPFVYVHLLRLLNVCYLPVFAYVLGRLGSRRPSTIVLSCIAILIVNLFFLGINTVSTKLADPYGHDLDDLRILSHCKLAPTACRTILTSEIPEETRASLRPDGGDNLV